MTGLFAFLRDEEAAHAGTGKKERMRGAGPRETAGKSWGMSAGDLRAKLLAAAELRTTSYAAGMRALPVSSSMRDLTVRSLSTLEALVPTVYSGSSLSVLYPLELRRPLQMQK